MTRILICDDHAVVRAGLRLLLEKHSDFAIVGEASDAQESIDLAAQTQPEIVIMDLSMPGLGGLAAIPMLQKVVPTVKVLILTVHEDEAYFFAALRAGAAGYVLKGVPTSELIASLDLIIQGGVPVPRILGQRLAADYLGSTTDRGALSEREQEMLGLIAEGRINKEIAEKMSLSLRTVERYRSMIMSKLGFHNKAELMRYAVRYGMLNSNPFL
jgi:two-component system response regulator NreC